ncbi:MAG: BMP family ABC transporter substrate-binding protein, partial [Sediminispirochaetaceae bacterium]
GGTSVSTISTEPFLRVLKKGRRFRIIPSALSVILLSLSLLACSGETETAGENASGEEAESGEKGPESNTDAEEAAQKEEFTIAVFIPGALAGSPLYQELADGAEKAAGEYDFAEAKVIEGGFNQGEWLDRITELAASEEYELIVSSNPALPEISAKVAERIPEQKFLLFDGYLEGNESIYTFRYNQREQAFLAGHMAGLVTTSEELSGSGEELKIGLVAGQEYPDMNDAIKPGYLEGARRVHEEIELDFRVVGNWYDASKAYELAKEMISGGVDVILPIAGGANQGVLKAVEENSIYAIWYDSNGYNKSPGRIMGNTAILQEDAVYEKTKEAIEGSLNYGEGLIVGVEEGWIDFIDDDPLYTEHVPESLRERQSEIVEMMKKGEISLPLR